jgi:TonB family protein
MIFEGTFAASRVFSTESQRAQRRTEADGFVSLVTLVVWGLCFVVGVLGFVLPYGSFRLPEPEAKPVRTELVNVKIEKEQERPKEVLPAAAAPAVADVAVAPAPPVPVAVPEAPAIAVAAPSPAIAFALPVTGYAKIVDRAEAGFRGTAGTSRPGGSRNGVARPGAVAPGPQAGAPQVSRGEWVDDMETPEYPREALLAGQAGTVKVEFTVDGEGRLVSAEIVTATRWPVLNQAALRVVKAHHYPAEAVGTWTKEFEYQISR